jgi:hypothetical protein
VNLTFGKGGYVMRFLATLIAVTATGLFVTAAPGQDYWEYEPWEGEWERHEPTEGLEYEYENGDIDVEAEQYEYEPGEGYHEQEWYDPSDWFSIGRDFDYETDSYEGGYYDDGYYDDDWFYDYYDDNEYSPYYY